MHQVPSERRLDACDARITHDRFPVIPTGVEGSRPTRGMTHVVASPGYAPDDGLNSVTSDRPFLHWKADTVQCATTSTGKSGDGRSSSRTE